MSKACIFLADGFEEVEALTVVDLLRRAGIEITMVSMSDDLSVRGRSRIEVNADVMWDKEIPAKSDILILPGGQPGTTFLENHKGLRKALDKADAEGKLIAAICAAPTVLAKHGMLRGKKATCYPGLENILKENGAEVVTEEKVVSDGNIITSRGVGTAIAFSLEIISHVIDEQAAHDVAGGIVYKD